MFAVIYSDIFITVAVEEKDDCVLWGLEVQDNPVW